MLRLRHVATAFTGHLRATACSIHTATPSVSPREYGLPTDVYVKEAADRLEVPPSLVKSILHPDRELTVQLVGEALTWEK
jgi:hypothetical protein